MTTVGYVEIFLDVGTTFSHTLNMFNERTNSPINVAGYQFYSTMKRSYYSQNTSANIVCTIVDAANGEVTLSMDQNVTSNLAAGRYVYDVITVNTNGVTEKLIEGIMHVSPTVTIV